MENRLPPDQLEWISYHLRRLGLKKLKFYYRTAWWKSRVAKFWREHGRKCQKCGGTKNLQVHHVRYDHMGYEYDSDLKGLCEDCHKGTHRKWTRRVLRDRQRIKKAPGRRRSFLSRLFFD